MIGVDADIVAGGEPDEYDENWPQHQGDACTDATVDELVSEWCSLTASGPTSTALGGTVIVAVNGAYVCVPSATARYNAYRGSYVVTTPSAPGTTPSSPTNTCPGGGICSGSGGVTGSGVSTGPINTGPGQVGSREVRNYPKTDSFTVTLDDQHGGITTIDVVVPIEPLAPPTASGTPNFPQLTPEQLEALLRQLAETLHDTAAQTRI